MPRFADVAVQLPVSGTYSYRIPERLADRDIVGARVLVPFGNRGVTGVVVAQVAQPPDGVDRIRDLYALLDPEPMIVSPVLELCRWIAGYYECPPGESLRAALPPGTSITADQLVEVSDAGKAALAGAGGALPRQQLALLGLLSAEGGPIPQRSLTKGKVRAKDVALLVEAGLATYLLESSKARIKDKSVRVAKLRREVGDEDRARLARSKARLAVLDALVEAGGEADVEKLRETNVRASAHLRSLVGDGLVEMSERVVRIDAWERAESRTEGMVAPAEALELNEAQDDAVRALGAQTRAEQYTGFLLYGITGSGKTEVYLQSIAECLRLGKNAIVLVPEISLTPQLAARFRARFGPEVAVLHSALTIRERYDEWHRLREGQARIALGARSAIFAPIDNVGMIVVDEEHDSSFKQEEGVRYHARDVALVRAKKAGAVCVLGSATPSLESYYGTEVGRLELLELPKRATGKPLPDVELVDLRRNKPDKESMLTAPLATAIEETLNAGDQIILFLNRRGFDTFVTCTACGHAFRCRSCSVSLTYHRFRARLMCHYCAHEEALPRACPECDAQDSISRRGFGTEKITDAVAARFPNAKVERLDRDVASGAAIQSVLGRVARREVDILVGTQMVTKGHDFPGVTLVGVLCADTGLSLPDFRASEKTFQLLTQVAGRAGRGKKSGRVLVQSYRCDALAIKTAAQHDFDAFYAGEVRDRADLSYPPHGYLVAIRLDGANASAVIRQARRLSDAARRAGTERGVSVLGPAEAPLAKLKGRTRWHLWLQASERKTLRATVHDVLAANDPPAGVRVAIDVDPVSAL
ncbi:MAG: primosomal protein N' [Myxococcales bacterium]|nr:primosomal protein N' [Myxococcales bacterium]